ncbi:MAG TPA: glycosyltransferase family 4 protein [Pontiellaceae bacterium]|nr:glycosyltransferase family 4 protein [Pontiellaceae bacterium]HPR82779.1 glycosyltransferase family 4 protein [Pontiellaceae bacterium]
MRKLHGTIAHVMRRFVPDKWGGTETVVFNLARELEQNGLNSPIFCTDMFARTGAEKIDGVTVRRFRYCFPWFGLSEEAKSALRLKGGSPLSLPLFFALLFQKDLTLIHTHVGRRLGGIARTVARLRRVPYVIHVHGGRHTVPQDQYDQMVAPVEGKREWGKLFGLLFGSRRVFDDAAAVICVGQSEADEMRRRSPGRNIHYLPNGVHVRRFAAAGPDAFRNAYGLENRKFVLCLSRIDFQKNQLLLVRAFAEFRKTHPDWNLVFIGSVSVEEYHRQIIAEIARLGLNDAVLIIPGLKPDDPLLPSAYKAADLFVLPSANEPFGIVILEAWAAGTPVIATRVGGIPGFTTDGENILLTDDNNDARLTEQMNRLAGSPELRAKLATNGFAEVSANYDWSAIAERVMKIYEEVLK